MTYPQLTQADIAGKKVLLRAGFDVPIENGTVTDTSRIETMVPTMKYILENGGALIVMAHQGRPKGKRVPEMSQKPLVPVLTHLLGVDVFFEDACVGDGARTGARDLEPGQVLLLENLRYEKGEKSKDSAERDALGQELADLAHVYVNDAFTNCHRDHASMTSVPKFLPSYMGLHLAKEVEQLSRVIDDPKRPLVLIVGGLKMETKVPVIERYLSNGDDILLGGGVANTFIAARGFDVGASKYEQSFVPAAQEIMLQSEKEKYAMVHVPHDALVASQPSEDAGTIDLPVEDIEGDMAVFDVGSVTVKRYCDIISRAGMIIWNGPMGYMEIEAFSHGTKKIADAVAAATEGGAISILGGGDTIDFHTRYGLPLDAYTHVSMGGGAMLEFVAGKTLPALQALSEK